MKQFRVLLLFLLIFQINQTLIAQNISNEGTNFWTVFPTHDPSRLRGSDIDLLANLTVFITSKTNAVVTVSCGSFSQTLPVNANTNVGFNVPRDNSYISYAQTNYHLINKGIHIVVQGGKTKVAAYVHIYAGARSAASLILPVEALGQKYYSMNYEQEPRSGQNYIVLAATESNTDILIHESSTVTKRVTLAAAGDIFEYMPASSADLSGVFVEVDPATSPCKKFAMFSGSTSAGIGNCSDNLSLDPLFQQLYPIGSWGKNYGIIPFIDRKYIIRILAQEDNTVVEYDGRSISLNKGQFHDSDVLSYPVFASANKLICVAQYSLTQSCSGVNGNQVQGDPEMVILNSTDFNIKKVTLFSSSKENIEHKYVNVCMKTTGTGSFRINARAPIGVWRAIPANPIYSYLQVEVFDENLTLEALEGFNSIAYGFGEFESYAYSAGTNLATNNYLLINNTVTNIDNPDACIDQASNFKLVLPYAATKIIWELDDDTSSTTDVNPVYTLISSGEETLYEYIYKKNKIYTALESHNLNVIVSQPLNAGGCSGAETEYNFSFNVDPLPTADFLVDIRVCPDLNIVFSDKSVSNVTTKAVTRWLWDFGDNTEPSTLQSPEHTFKTSGVHKIKLIVGTDLGCESEVKEAEILVLPKMLTQFTAASSGCANDNFLIKDESSLSEGKIVKWTWKFSDQLAMEIRTDNLPFNHVFTSTGTYTISLVTESDFGCISQFIEKQVVITDKPILNFSIPEVCLKDASAIFLNSTLDVDGAEFTYLWNFGDSNSGTLNQSESKDGSHKYNSMGAYVVTLTATNTNGCTNTNTQTIFVNGSEPTASFEVIGENGFCSNQAVTVINRSSVVPGNITRLEWYPDYANNPAWVVIDENPTDNKEYQFNYAVFNTPATKNIAIRLVVYSGSECLNELTKSILLYPSPILSFTTIPPICLNAGKTLLSQASETGNLQGTANYAGKGVSPDGVFDPLNAGVGIHEITYTYTSQNGCFEKIVQTLEVLPIGQLSVDYNVNILRGGQKQLVASSTGINLKYKWTPSFGLDRDDILNPIATPVNNITYTLTATTEFGCSVSERVNVNVLEFVGITNTISPNNDGINDVWNIKYIDTYPNVTVEVFNRYGNKVFFSNGYSIPFDGNQNNQQLPVGTYYYIIDPRNGRARMTGSLTIIR
jgi:gliding motility-associated-like protein